MEIKTKDMDEIYLFLINAVKMKEEQATQVWKELSDGQDCLDMENVAKLDEKGWEEVFTNTGLKSGTKSRLRDAISQYSFFLFHNILLFVNKRFAFFLDAMKQGNTRVRVDLNNEKWESMDIQLGDEVKCSYLIDDSGQVVIQSINFPEMYSGQVHVSNREAVIEISPLSASKEGPQKVIFWKYASKSAMEISPRDGDTLKFRLQFVKNEWQPKKVKLVPHNPPFCVVVATFNKRQMEKVPLSGSAMHALTLFNKANQAPKNTSSYVSLFLNFVSIFLF
ncbi:hypothetical protein RFI_20472 [Reticulomyxa filosa]|uniref:Uncharacterized protein n=1 Tax=Reticulomyxa filosa TaxID=46433 RepID=X6MSE5_RETFI|nr:hypothetical protein RFI_20472 [Reticulomyxa filosa]|eukprot:ETO16868.1 hypothetical protein RFI_20472 [Reticulomyxa filosa]